MVWGMQEPGSFGDYFPDGDYVGWDEQLKSYYSNEMSDAEKAEMGMEERLLLSKFANKLVRDLGPLKLQEQPKEFRAVKTYKNPAALMVIGAPVVNEKLKSIIEKLEPGVHQFWPITITMPKGQVYPEQYYGLRISQFHDSFSPEESEAGAFREGGIRGHVKYRVNRPNKQFHAGLAMRAELFGGKHLWRERKLDDPHFLLSDTLHDEITRHELRVPKMYKLKEVAPHGDGNDNRRNVRRAA